MATTGPIIDLFKATLGTATRNGRHMAQHLRDCGKLRGEVGKRNLHLTTSEAVTWVIAQALAPKITAGNETADYWRSLHVSTIGTRPEKDRSLLDGCGLRGSRSLGEALDALVDDMRSGAFRQWCDREPEAVTLTVEFHSEGYAQIFIDRTGADRALFFGFGPPDASSLAVKRITRLDGALFESLAELLGPLDDENENDRSPAGPADVRLESV
ncbi:MAG: hypothetical protein K9G60_01825 [Pseudolabrys sp.]|nr:hypothetical protein [Pseudolabrys sp.]